MTYSLGNFANNYYCQSWTNHLLDNHINADIIRLNITMYDGNIVGLQVLYSIVLSMGAL